MNYRYFGTFIAGTEAMVAELLRQRTGEAVIRALSAGAVEFDAPVPYSELNLFCFNNLFRVMYTAPAAPTKAGLEKFLRRLPTAPVDWPAAREGGGKGRTFRLVVSCKNQLVGVSRQAKEAVEQRLAAETKLRLDRSLPDREFWVLVRDDARAYLLRRLTRHRAYDKLLHPGELHPELAYMLCWLTGPGPADVVADPFCGYGSIPVQRSRRFPFARVYAFDRDPRMLAAARQKLGERAGVVVEAGDALALAQRLDGEKLDAVITDPPWGLYEGVGMGMEKFYRRMLEEFEKVLKEDGKAVVLTAAKREFSAALEQVAGLVQKERYDILVSGKKSAIFLLARENRGEYGPGVRRGRP